MNESNRHWNYRVIEIATFGDDGAPIDRTLEIREVHYEDDRVVGHGAAAVGGDSVEEIDDVLARMKGALSKPMLKTMIYKGFEASVEYSEEDVCFVGRITGIGDVIGFHGATEQEAEADFRAAVNDYLEARAADTPVTQIDIDAGKLIPRKRD